MYIYTECQVYVCVVHTMTCRRRKSSGCRKEVKWECGMWLLMYRMNLWVGAVEGTTGNWKWRYARRECADRKDVKEGTCIYRKWRCAKGGQMGQRKKEEKNECCNDKQQDERARGIISNYELLALNLLWLWWKKRRDRIHIFPKNTKEQEQERMNTETRTSDAARG